MTLDIGLAVCVSVLSLLLASFVARMNERARCLWLVRDARHGMVGGNGGSALHSLEQLAARIESGRPSLADTRLYELNRAEGH